MTTCAIGKQAPRVIAHRHAPFAQELQRQLLRLNSRGDDELHHAELATNALVRVYAQVVGELLVAGGLRAAQVCAVGAHGQTVRHRPQEFDATGYTLQLMNGALLAELCGIDVICDFRSRDVAAGGQGAPLVPALHAALFAAADEDIAVLNLGGIGNLTLLPAQGAVLGFDCGPGNALLDAWCLRHLGTAYDDAGRWGASGQVDQALLQRLLAEPFLARLPPKSTGRDLFNMTLAGGGAESGIRHLASCGRPGHAGGVQRPRRHGCIEAPCATHEQACWCAVAAPSMRT